MKYEFSYSDLDATTIYVKPNPDGELIAAFEKDLEGISVDRSTAKTIKAEIIADCKELNRRTFAHKIAEFREQQNLAKSSRNRAKAARVNDMLNLAEEHERQTMPRQKPAPATRASDVHAAVLSDIADSAPRGRRMGEKK
jgi:hypothetical protein